MNENNLKLRIKKNAPKIKIFMKNIWTYRYRLLFINFLAVFFVLFVLLFLTRPYFISTITILPDYGGKSNLGSIGNLANMVGVNIGGNSTLQIYSDILISESILSRVIYAEYDTKQFEEPVNLISYFEITSDDTTASDRVLFLDAMKILIDKITINYKDETGILKVIVKMPESALSAAVANNLIYGLERYVLTQRKFYASEQRKYLEKRLKTIKDSLYIVENLLKKFREKNVMISSPSLLLQQNRLVRKIEVMTRVFKELNIQLELVKLEQIKEVPILNIKEYANEPINKAGPPRTKIFILSFLFIFIFSIVYYGYKNLIFEYIEIFKKQKI